MSKFIIDPTNFDKWAHQNGARHTGAYFEGCLLDNFVLNCKRGVAAVCEHYVNPNQSDYMVTFAPYDDREAVGALWDEFALREHLALTALA